MVWACSTHGIGLKSFGRRTEGKRPFEDLSVKEIILKWISKKTKYEGG
jgi:hypothetical protein